MEPKLKEENKQTEHNLPVWNLADFYSDRDSIEIKNDLSWSEDASLKFKKTYKGKLSTLSGRNLAEVIRKYEKIIDNVFRLSSYAQLTYACDMQDQEIRVFYQNIIEQVNNILSHTVFFQIEINQIKERVLFKQMKDEKLQHFRPWINAKRIFKPFQLSENLENLLHQKSLTGSSAWSRLFDETMANLQLTIGGENKTLANGLNDLSDGSPKIRRKTADALGNALRSHASLLSLIINTLAKDKEIEDTLRGYQKPISNRNCENQVGDEVVDALVEATKANYKNLSHRYYKIKAGWFKTKKLNYWDRNAPIPFAEDKRFSWDESREIVLGAFADFHPEMAKVAATFFDRGWIDALPRDGKNSGAFAHPTVTSHHPYIFLNFHGKSRDVMTLAHELGHGIHQVLAGPCGTLMADTPLTLAETASVFGEMLTFQSLLKLEKCPIRRRVLLAGKVEDMLNTVVRQVAFHEFENRVHSERKNGELSVEKLGSLWMETQSESLGPDVKLDERYSIFWAYIPHFIHSPFYVYAYAFGDCLVNSLYQIFKNGHLGFEEKYLGMLRAGGTKLHDELLAPFSLNASEPEFWKQGLNVISSFIDELEA